MTSSHLSPITTHVLDTALGNPAEGVPVTLEKLQSRDVESKWSKLAIGVTNVDGRVAELLPKGSLTAGIYRMTFDTAAYFRSLDSTGFYPQVQVEFEVTDLSLHYHVPLLLSPYGYSTYRGS